MHTLTYTLCKSKIEKKQFISFEQMHEMLDVFYAGERLTTDEYQELSTLLSSQRQTA
ncbi:hypothetical protein [Desulfosporosinus meridiei]|uniref:Uncharacterized protein n=1 Tax=Desulfosporosinus meridiei (strain ATCC BAA-275 / DSM 13257 / KCTC 12902 / NCIMB 13706 / S10) TaxID=768704 RepID=J7J1E5_DESMD|nr:hypothetical protein [Desulfosporosinus meridiei]AFQ45143.1 hypothetical protein Desmer_3266 [Desulfosporosinus meridiei DSM 13257]